jgi:hypothetical protein
MPRHRRPENLANEVAGFALSKLRSGRRYQPYYNYKAGTEKPTKVEAPIKPVCDTVRKKGQSIDGIKKEKVEKGHRSGLRKARLGVMYHIIVITIHSRLFGTPYPPRSLYIATDRYRPLAIHRIRYPRRSSLAREGRLPPRSGHDTVGNALSSKTSARYRSSGRSSLNSLDCVITKKWSGWIFIHSVKRKRLTFRDEIGTPLFTGVSGHVLCASVHNQPPSIGLPC